MKKTIFLLLMAVACWLGVLAQELPQFKSGSYEGWVYNNPNVVVDGSNVSGGKIALYTNSQGLVLTLTSPVFSCQGMDSIAATVIWYMPGVNRPGFDINKTALTMAIDDDCGQPIDSVTCVAPLLESQQTLSLTLAVPQGLQQAKLRFVSWNADVVNCGAIKRALFTAITGSSHEDVMPGDVDGDNFVNINDVTVLINYLLTSSSEGVNLQGADVDGNGIINISDVTDLINYLLTRS